MKNAVLWPKDVDSMREFFAVERPNMEKRGKEEDS